MMSLKVQEKIVVQLRLTGISSVAGIHFEIIENVM